MDVSKLQDIWKLMSEYKFFEDPDSINDDLRCIICNKLTIDACKSVCNCQYCYKCIADFLSGADKYCPGGKTECNMEYLIMDRDVFRNSRMNNRILRLKVLCPNNSCKSKVELAQMHEHLRVCTKQLVECPYITIGCNMGEDSKETLLTHLHDDTLTHTQLLIECVNHLKNEVNGLKKILELGQLEVVSLGKQLQRKEIDTKEILEQVEQQRKEIYLQMEEQKREITEQLSKREKNESIKRENRIVSLEEKLDTMITKMKSSLANKRNENDDVVLQEKLWTLQQKIDEIGLKSDRLKKEEDKRMEIWIKWNKLCPYVNADFAWRIDKLAKKKKKLSNHYIYSESFYANNYRFCLRMYLVNNEDNIAVDCHIMKGEHDGDVVWPMRQTVTLSVIDQHTSKTLKTVKYKYDLNKYNKGAFERSTNEVNNCGIGTWPFIILESINDKAAHIVNDFIVVSCVIGGQ